MSGIDRLRGVAFLVSGVVALAFIGYLALQPGAFVTLHPLPLVLLLLVTAGVAFWQARELLD